MATMKPLTRLLAPWMTALALAALLSTEIAAGEGRIVSPVQPPRRGFAILSHSIGQDVSINEVLAFSKTCRMNLVIIDFGWITYSWPQTDLKAVEKLCRALREAQIDVAAMYRPRVLGPAEAKIQYAQHENGKIADDHNELCFAHEDSVAWGAQWGARILAGAPSLNCMILYNLRPACWCADCRGDPESRTSAFIDRCRRDWGRIRRDIRIGHVGVEDAYADKFDFYCPFLAVLREGAGPMDPAPLVRDLKQLQSAHEGKPLIPFLKICWGVDVQNDATDVIRSIDACEREKLGFILWYYEWVFHSPRRSYDRKRIIAAMGGKWADVARYLGN